MSKVKVLLVDDEKEYAETLAERLRTRGFDVDVANSGEGALEKLSAMVPAEHELVRVLLVDDEADYIEALAERLRTRGFEVEVANSGAEAIEQTRGTTFHAVVMDYAMPMMNGIETVKELRAIDPTIPFILLTGEATIKAAVDAARLGAVDVLEKPVDIDTVVEKISLAKPRADG